MKKSPQQNPIGKRRQQQKADTKALILENAIALFNEFGFEKTTIRDIAFRSEVAVGTIFAHFDDKFSLLCAVLFDELAAEVDNALQTLPRNKSIAEQFIHFAENLYTYWAKRQNLAPTFLKEIAFAKNEWSRAFDKQVADFTALVANLLIQAQKNDEIRQNVDCQLTATILSSHYIFILVWGLKADTIEPEKMIGFLRKMTQQTIAGISTTQTIP